MNLCVVLIRNSEDEQFDDENSVKPRNIENIFWKSIDTESKIVKMADQYQLKANNEVHYISCVSNKWTTQKECALCFPKDSNLISERPILKVNKSSVVPMTMIGLGVDETLVLPSAIKYINDNKNIKKTNIPSNTFHMLKHALMYGHYKRGDNHYEYYIKTDKLFQAIEKYDYAKLDEWINDNFKTTETTGNESIIKYDFLVAPLHKTNAAFVEYISEKAFGTAKMILWIDVNREYRDNIKTKYSNLTQLYYNLIEANKNAEINFHYIDDTITTGYSFERIKNLLTSLFPRESIKEKTNIKVNIFASVILLLSRCSNDTKIKYIEDTNKFYSYIDLNISVMRHHKDACSQCKKYNDYSNLISLSSSNYLAEMFYSYKNDNKICIISHQEEMTECTEEEYYKLYYTHLINSEMSLLDYKKNDETEVFKLFVKIMKNVYTSSSKNKCKKIITILKVISSPFIEYRYSVQLAAFDIMLRLTQAFIFNTKDDKLENLQFAIEKNVSPKEKNDILRTLLEQLSKMGANYMLRYNIIFGFIRYIKTNNSVCSEESWINFYAKIIKQSLYFNKQGSRSIYLEDSILNCLRDAKVSYNMKNSLDKLLMLVYLENNIIINDVLNEMVIAINRDELMANNMNPVSENSTILEAINATKQLSNDSSINKRVVKTLMQYYCSDYLEFNSIKANAINTDNVITKVLSSLTIAKLLLVPKGDLTGLQDNKSYYYTLLNHLSNVLEISSENTQGVQLYIVTDNSNGLDQDIKIVFISSSNNNIKEGNPDFSNFIRDTFTDEKLINIGNTYYYTDKTKYELSCRYNLIKITNNDNNISKSRVHWCFVYTSDIEDNYMSLKKARNFLVLREALRMRLKKDFENNLFDEYYQLKNKVSKISNQKAGSHTPFEELRIAFSKIRDEIESKDICMINNNQTRMITECLKMISDSLISKWYVFNITDSFPDTMPKHSKPQVDYLLSYEKLFKVCDKFKINEQEGTIVPNITWDLSFDKSVLLKFPNKSSFIWCCAFYSSIINAIRHGYQCNNNLNNEFKVSISVFLKQSNNKKYICVSNDCYMNENNQKQEEGITLTALKYYFDNYYGKDEFQYGQKENTFTVRIPCECDKENEDE